MRHLIAILVLIASSTTAQTTHERYILIQQERVESNGNVWRLAWVDRGTDAPWWHWANERGLTNASLTALPCLVDAESWESVQVTGTIAQAKTELTGRDEVRRPARKALKDYLAGTSQKDKRKALRQAITSADTVPTLRKALRDMDEFRELIEDAEDERQLLGRKKDHAP